MPCPIQVDAAASMPGPPVSGRTVAERPVPKRPMLKRLGRSAGVRAVGAGVVGAYLRFALATTHWRFHDAGQMAAIVSGTPFVFVCWHERLAMMPALWLHVRARRRHTSVLSRFVVMISGNRDGRMYGSVLRDLGIDVVHASRAKGRDQKGGAAGLRTLLGALAGGDQVGLIPDGPRGPPHRAAPGVAQLAAISGVPVIPVSAQTTRRRCLRSWDRMVVPLPFGRGVVVCGPPVPVQRGNWAEALPLIEAGMDAVQRRADALLGGAAA